MFTSSPNGFSLKLIVLIVFHADGVLELYYPALASRPGREEAAWYILFAIANTANKVCEQFLFYVVETHVVSLVSYKWLQ